MRCRLTLFVGLVGVLASTSAAQPDSGEFARRYFGLSAGLGVTVISATDIVNYVNAVSARYGDAKQNDFGVGAEFFGAGEYQVSDEWSVKLEWAYLLKSYSVPRPPLQDISLSSNVDMPTVILHRLLCGTGYVVKFGGGMGYHFAHFTEDDGYATFTYTSSGVGVKLDGEANTEFDEHLWGYIGADIRGDIMGELKTAAGKPLVVGGTNAKMSFFSVGLKFGLSYFF